MCNADRIRAVALFILMAISSLHAVDGVVLIDQSHALAGNITPGDTPGFPVMISQPGSYRLTSNLVVPDVDTSGIVVMAEGVTIDLNGFSIIGPEACTPVLDGPATCPAAGKGTGILAGSAGVGGPRSVKVSNGSVRGMGLDGIALIGDNSEVEKVSSDGNGRAGFIVNGSVFKCSADGNGAQGMLAIIVRDSMAVNNARDGIDLDGRGGVAIGDVSSFNGGVGILSQNGTVTGNTITLNTGAGVSAICPSSIVNNTVVQNKGGSINAPPDDGNCVLANNAMRP